MKRQIMGLVLALALLGAGHAWALLIDNFNNVEIGTTQFVIANPPTAPGTTTPAPNNDTGLTGAVGGNRTLALTAFLDSLGAPGFDGATLVVTTGGISKELRLNNTVHATSKGTIVWDGDTDATNFGSSLDDGVGAPGVDLTECGTKNAFKVFVTSLDIKLDMVLRVKDASLQPVDDDFDKNPATPGDFPQGIPGPFFHSFSNLIAGGVDLTQVVAIQLEMDTSSNLGSRTLNVAIDSIETVSTCVGSIGNFVWQDVNHNGLQDAGEPGISNVTVRLFNLDSSCGSSVPAATAVTDVNGLYQFAGLCLGDYKVVVDVDASPVLNPYNPTLIDANNNNNDDIDSEDPMGALVTLTDAKPDDPTIDFGFEAPCTGEIGNFVWHDTIYNGLQDDGEPGIAGVNLTLLKDPPQSDFPKYTTTDANGLYKFMMLCEGSYTVVVDMPQTALDGFTPTIIHAPAAPDNDTDSDDPAGQPVTLVGDDDKDPTIDFGFVCTGTIGNRVWHDVNGNGLQDDEEPGIAGVTLHLLDASGIIATTQTANDGTYEFSKVCPGTYQVVVDPLPANSPGLVGFEPTDMYVTSGGNPIANNDTDSDDAGGTDVILPVGNPNDPTIDFGFVMACDGTIGNRVWNDKNHNGIQDAGEPGIAGVIVNLFDSDGLIATEMTDPTGLYMFGNLCPLTPYTVQVDMSSPALDGFMPTLIHVNGEPSPGDDTDSDNPAGQEVTLPVANPRDDLTIDFGFVGMPRKGEGCTPGFWKNNKKAKNWPAPYTPQTSFSDVFEDAFPGETLLSVLSMNGGGLSALGRHTVAALLNAASPGVDYGLTADDVIALFNGVFPDGDYEGLKDMFAELNEQGCPLDNSDKCNNDHGSHYGGSHYGGSHYGGSSHGDHQYKSSKWKKSSSWRR